MSGRKMKHFRTCNICEAMCGIVVEHDGREVISIRGDEDDVFSRGHICPKAVALRDIHEDPDRLRRPQMRVGDRWEDVTWDRAFDAIAERIVEIQRRHGNNALALYFGNPTVHNLGALLYGFGFIKSMETRSRFSATSVDQLPHMLASLEMFGHQLLMPVPDVDRCDYLVMLGANPLVSNGSIMTAPGMKRRLAAIQRRGGRVVVVDPRLTETAKLADIHHAIRPGTDGLLLAAMVHTLFEEKLERPGRLASFTDGFDELRRTVEPFAPERVAEATGIEASAIRELVRGFAGASRPACYGRLGVCTQRFGGVNAWLVNAFNVVAGSLDQPGGMMFTKPAVDFVRMATLTGQTGHFDKGRSRVRGLPEFGGEYPAVTLAEEIETPGDGRIRGLITFAGNPVLSTPNGRRLDRALGELDLMVSVDIYRNETTRHADFILPPTSQLEQSHYDVAFHVFAVRNTAKYSPTLFEPPQGGLADWQILLELGTRVGIARGGLKGIAARATRGVLGRLGPEGILDKLLRLGPYGLRLADLLDAPHGLDLGALEPCLPERMPHERIQLVPRRIAKDVERLEASIDEAASDELVLIGRRQLRTNNSWLHNSPPMIKGRDRCTLLMHPDDAEERGLEHGSNVEVTSRVGRVVVPLHVTDQIRRGVVSLPHGFGHDRPGAQLKVAAATPGASVNDLTDEAAVDPLTGTAALNGLRVEVRAETKAAQERDAAQ
jgi:anaerobic selenocysteine-containing dehydrogenase